MKPIWGLLRVDPGQFDGLKEGEPVSPPSVLGANLYLNIVVWYAGDDRWSDQAWSHLGDPKYSTVIDARKEARDFWTVHNDKAESVIERVVADVGVMLKKYSTLSSMKDQWADPIQDNYYSDPRIERAILTRTNLSDDGRHIQAPLSTEIGTIATISDESVRNLFFRDIVSLAEKYTSEIGDLERGKDSLDALLYGFKDEISKVIDEISISETLAGRCEIEDMIDSGTDPMILKDARSLSRESRTPKPSPELYNRRMSGRLDST